MTHAVAMSKEQEPSLSVLAHAELTRSGFRLTFPVALAFERLQELRFIALWGAAAYFCLGVLLNLTVIQDPDWKSIAIQLLGSTLTVLAIIHAGLGRKSSTSMRENALLICCLINCLAAILIVAAKPAHATLRDFLLAIPPASFVLIFVRLRFNQAIIFFLVDTGVYALAVFHRPEIRHSDATFLIGFITTLQLPALIGAHTFERALRRIYLHGLLERLRNENLAARNVALTGLSYTDSLTGIANRRRLDEALSELVAAPGSTGALLLIDIDRFKEFNDSYGHLAGDACLCHVAQCLASHMRAFDLLARFGGEEFAVLLPDTEIEEAAGIAERLREAVQNLHFDVRDKQVSVTISVGIAARQGLSTSAALVGVTDTALYAAKHAGRNRVHITPEHESLERLSA